MSVVTLPKIERDIKFKRYSPRSPHFQMKREDLWPNVDKMKPGDTYVIEYDQPGGLRKSFKKICVEKTGQTIEELNLIVVSMANKGGIIVLKT